MTTVRQHAAPAGAFTLIEVMLAVTILGLVMTAIYATWSAGLNGWKRTAGISENFQRERIVMATLADLTKSIVYAASNDGLYDIVSNHDARTGDSVSFVTASTVLLPATEAVATGMRRVTVGLQRDQHGRSYLGISNVPALAADRAPEPVIHALSAEVCGFAVRFRDAQDGTWKDKWEEANLLPMAIEYTLGFGANDGRTPPVVVTRTVELPIAPYAMQLLGQAVAPNQVTNTPPPKLKLSDPPGGGSDNR